MFMIFHGREHLNEGIGDINQVIAARAEEAENAVSHGCVTLFQHEISNIHRGQ